MRLHISAGDGAPIYLQIVNHGLVGENGAGKTTLVKTILGLLKPDRGTTCSRKSTACPTGSR